MHILEMKRATLKSSFLLRKLEKKSNLNPKQTGENKQ